MYDCAWVQARSGRVKELVLGFLFSEDRPADGIKVLLIEKKNPAWQAGKLNGVGGKVEENELPLEAMVREFHEEVGIHTFPSDWNLRLTLEGPDWRVFCYRSYGYPHLAIQREAERPVIADALDLPRHVFPNLRWIVPLLLDTNPGIAKVEYE